MPTFSRSADTQLFYTIDDFTDPWRESDAVVLLHGNAESGEAWRAWVPYLAGRYKVVRPDMRGFGRSSTMASDFSWSADVFIEDLVQLTRSLQLKKFHLVGAKIAGTIALRFAALHPELVRSLCVIGVSASSGKTFNAAVPGWITETDRGGVRGWAAATMRERLGSKVSEAQIDWWTDLMGATAVSSQRAMMDLGARLDVVPDLPRIECPTLVVAANGSPLWSLESTEAWQKCIPDSELVVMESDSFHLAASEPDEVAPVVRAFIDRKASSR